MSAAMQNAIKAMRYEKACRVALEYKTRFWERFARPIYGSCSTTTDIPGIGTICYPSYNINSTGPAAVLASFATDEEHGVDWASVAEEQHVQYVVDAMAEIHGDVAREQYTGKHRRHCGALDEFAAGSWASPATGSHEMFLPEYFATHSHVRAPPPPPGPTGR